jgi:hypothetical protein
MAIALTFVFSCEVLGLAISFLGTCWGHVMFKCCQHAVHDYKVCHDLTFISIREHNPFCRKLSHGPKEV